MKIFTKNILNETTGILLNGVNCQRSMGAGIAKAYYTKWPEVRERYMEIPKEQMALGMIQAVNVEKNLFVVNGWTQEFYGNDGKQYAEEYAIMRVLLMAGNLARTLGLTVKTPMIGCGLAGIKDHTLVLDLIERAELMTGVEFEVYCLEGEFEFTGKWGDMCVDS